MPNFRFYVPDPYRPGRKITATMRQNRSEVSKAKVGQTCYVYKARSDDCRPEHLEIRIIVLTAGDPTREHPEPPIKLGWRDRLRSSMKEGGRMVRKVYGRRETGVYSTSGRTLVNMELISALSSYNILS